MRISWVLIVALLMAGCHAEDVSVGTHPWEAPVQDLPQELPGDEYRESTKIGRYNASREQRRRARAREILDEMREVLPTKSDEELIDMLWTGSGGYSGVAHYVASGGNLAIEGELQRRGETARAALEANHGDPRPLYTGPSGPPDSVGHMCRRLLDRLPGNEGSPPGRG